jgi:hypothetical protein
MLNDLKYIFVKVLILLIIVLVYYLITNYNSNKTNTNTIETFEDKIEQEKINYLKLKETYIEPEGTSLELLYTNYSGEELNQEEWENKTFDQCIDTCNKIDKCIGFSRDAVLDTEPAKCYPRTKLDTCHSNRKGNYEQMSKSLKFNSYIKSTTPNVINTCIGDTEMTLNRLIFIKSYSMPNKYIGNNGDGRASMIDKDTSELKKKCNFKIEEGKTYIGSVSFLHIDTNQYLYRDSNNNLIFKDVNKNSTEDKQRSSFNITDGLSNGIMFKVTPVEGETTDKFMFIDNKYIKISQLNNSSKTKNSNNKDTIIKNETPEALSTFYIIDTIINSTIINNKNKIPEPSMTTPSMTESNPSMYEPSMTNPSMYETSMPNPQLSMTNPSMYESSTMEGFSNSLDKSNEISFYNNLFNTNKNQDNKILNLQNYLSDTYLKPEYNSKLMSVTKKLNDNVLNKSLSTSLSKNEEEYNLLNELNKEIEMEIANKNIDLNVKNDKIINNLDKMRITDLANDYFFMKTLSSKK